MKQNVEPPILKKYFDQKFVGSNPGLKNLKMVNYGSKNSLYVWDQDSFLPDTQNTSIGYVKIRDDILFLANLKNPQKPELSNLSIRFDCKIPEKISTFINKYGQIYLLGGYDPLNKISYSSIYMYDMNRKSLISKANMKYPRCSFGFCATKTHLYVCGGKKNETESISSFERYDFLQDKWEILLDSQYSAVKPLLINLNDEFIYKLGGIVNGSKYKF